MSMKLLRSLSNDANTLKESLTMPGFMRATSDHSERSNGKTLGRTLSSGVKTATGAVVGGASKGLKAGVSGVAGGASKGLKAGAAGVAGAAGRAKNGRPVPNKKMAHRRKSEFNVFGDGELVSVDKILQNIKSAENNKKMTKVELEDLITGANDMGNLRIFVAVADMLKNDGERSWKYIRFIDSLRVDTFGDGLIDVQDYEKERRFLRDHIKEEAQDKPIQYSLKIELPEGTPAKTIIAILKEIQKYNLAKIEYMGGLFGLKSPEIGDKIAELCHPEDPDASIEESGELKEMIMFTLHYKEGDSADAEPPSKDKLWKKVLRRCIKRLGGQVVAAWGDSEHARSRSLAPSLGGDSSHNSPSRGSSHRRTADPHQMRAAIKAVRSRSPKRSSSGSTTGSKRRSKGSGSSENLIPDMDSSSLDGSQNSFAEEKSPRGRRSADANLMRAAIVANRAMSPKRSSKSPTPQSTLRRTCSEGHSPRSSSPRPSLGVKRRSKGSGTILEMDSNFLDGSQSSFGDDVTDSRKSKNDEDNGPFKPFKDLVSPVAEKKQSKRSSSGKQKIQRSISLKGERSEKKEVKRSSSKKLGRSISLKDESNDQNAAIKKTSRPRSTSPKPSYNWTAHISAGDLDASKSLRDMDENQTLAAKSA